MNDELIEEWGCEVPISFNTSKGNLRMEPGKIYNSDFISQSERSKREDECKEIGHMWMWMPKDQSLCMRCSALSSMET
jgi:hypothetical protein